MTHKENPPCPKCGSETMWTESPTVCHYAYLVCIRQPNCTGEIMTHSCKEGAKKGNVYCEVGRLRDENAELKGMVSAAIHDAKILWAYEPICDGRKAPDSVRAALRLITGPHTAKSIADAYKRSIETKTWREAMSYHEGKSERNILHDEKVLHLLAYDFFEAKAKALTPKEKS